MKTAPVITIALDKITHNAQMLCSFAKRSGVEVVGVSKGGWGNPDIAEAMIAGGVTGIGESRLENISRLREADRESGFLSAGGSGKIPFYLLRLPALSEIEQVVAEVDISLNSEPVVIQALGKEAVKQKKHHKIILMVELGDLREGVLPEDLYSVVEQTVAESGIELVGLGTNLSCFGGIIPTEKNLGTLVFYATQIQERYGIKLHYISGGNSSSIPLLFNKSLPAGINHLRLGESLLFGRETVQRRPIDGLYQDAFTLYGEVIELKKKDSVPYGERGEDSFGESPSFVDKGKRMRAIVNIGRADVDLAGLTPLESGLEIVGASSDHLLLDVTDVEREYCVGEHIPFSMNYSAFLRAMGSISVVQKTI